METAKKMTELTCADAVETFSEFVYVPFGDYMTDDELSSLEGSDNKGIVGQLMEIMLGKDLDTEHLDFVDGEQKTVTTDEFGRMPANQSVCVTNIGAHVDDMLDLVPYHGTWVADKIRHTVFVGICRPEKDDPCTWFVTTVLDCDFEHDPRLSKIFKQLAREYDELCLRSLDLVMETGHFGGCARGLRYIEHRPKDNRGQTVSSLCGGAVVYEKVKAVYLKRGFYNDVLEALAA